MKQLVKNRKRNQLKKVSLSILLVFVSLGLIILSISYYNVRQKDKDLVATLAANSILSLSLENISNIVSGTKRSLLLLSRIPVMREFKSEDFFTHLVVNKTNQINLSLDCYTPFLGLSYYEYIRTRNNMVYWGEVFLATLRRIIVSLGVPLEIYEDTDTTNGSLPSETIKFKLQTDFAHTIVGKAKNSINKISSNLYMVAHYIDKVSGLKQIRLIDPKGAENLMATNLINEKHIVSTEIMTLDGNYQAGVSKLSSFSYFKTSQFGPIKFSRAFLSGSVSFRESIASPLWRVFVPLRNRQRETIAYISSLIDISFLKRIANIGSFNKNVSLFFVDEDGTVIGHNDNSKVINQKNLKYSNQAVAKAMSGESSCNVENIYGKKYIVAYRPLHQFDNIDNPKWSMIFIAKSEHFTGQGGNLMSTSLIVLAVMALYVLFYTLRYLMILLHEEKENDI